MRTRKQLRIVLSALAGGALILAVSGCGGDSGSDTTTNQQTSSGGGPAMSGGAPPMSGMGGPPMTGGMPGAPMSGMGGGPRMSSGAPMGAAPSGAAAAPGAGTTKLANTTPPPSRPDPFKPWWDNTPKPPPVLSFLPPVRIAITNTAEPTEQPGIEIQEVPNRRVAGILTGNGVYALLEGGSGEPRVVKPGDTIDDYTVAAINPNSVVLKRKVGTQTFTQVVPLTDVGGGGGATFSGPRGPRGGFTGPPGMRGGLPGGMPGGGGGGTPGRGLE